MSKKKHSDRYRIAFWPRHRWASVVLLGIVGVTVALATPTGFPGLSLLCGLGAVLITIAIFELFAAKAAVVLGDDAIRLPYPRSLRGPRPVDEIPYAAITSVDLDGRDVWVNYHVDPLLFGTPPTHRTRIAAQEPEALLHAVQARMQRAQHHHLVARARNRYRVALEYGLGFVVAACGAGLLGAIRR